MPLIDDTAPIGPRTPSPRGPASPTGPQGPQLRWRPSLDRPATLDLSDLRRIELVEGIAHGMVKYWKVLKLRRRELSSQDLDQEILAALVEKQLSAASAYNPVRAGVRRYLGIAIASIIGNMYEKARAGKRGAGRLLLGLEPHQDLVDEVGMDALSLERVQVGVAAVIRAAGGTRREQRARVRQAEGLLSGRLGVADVDDVVACAVRRALEAA